MQSFERAISFGTFSHSHASQLPILNKVGKCLTTVLQSDWQETAFDKHMFFNLLKILSSFGEQRELPLNYVSRLYMRTPFFF